MKEIPLTQFLEGQTQENAARLIGVTQSRISQMLRAGSDVYVVVSARGTVISAYEKRPIGQRARAAA